MENMKEKLKERKEMIEEKGEYFSSHCPQEFKKEFDAAVEAFLDEKFGTFEGEEIKGPEYLPRCPSFSSDRPEESVICRSVLTTEGTYILASSGQWRIHVIRFRPWGRNKRIRVLVGIGAYWLNLRDEYIDSCV